MPDKKDEKMLSVEEEINNIRNQIYDIFNPKQAEIAKSDIWIDEIFDDFVIIHDGDKYFSVPYSMQNGQIVTGDKVEVEKDWKPASKSIWKVPQSESIKTVGDCEIEILGIPFGNSTHKDSDGEYFTKDTNLHLDKFPSPLLVYQHGYRKDDVTGKPQPIKDPPLVGGLRYDRTDDKGVWWKGTLDKASEYFTQLWESAKSGLLRASSQAITSLVRKNPDGQITNWPVVEISLLDRLMPANKDAVALPVMKSRYEQAGKEWPVEIESANENPTVDEAGEDKSKGGMNTTLEKEKIKMEPKEVEKTVADALKAYDEQKAAEAEKKAKDEAAIKAASDKAVETAKAEWEKEAAKGRRLPVGTPEVMKFNKIGKYDYIDPHDLALGIAVLKSQGKHVPNEALQSIAVRFADADKPKSMEDARTINDIKMAMGEAGIALKSDEIMQQDLSSYGDDWVAAGYSPRLWEQIRAETPVLSNIPQEEIPRGYESMKYLLESTDPVFYKVAESTDEDTTMKTPVASVTSSKVGTTNQSLSLAKMGARVSYSGELNEDSLIPIASQIPAQIVAAGKEYLEHVIVDGDTTTTQYLNINDVGGTPTSTDAFLLLDGLRHLPLVGLTSQKRAGGSLADVDFLETAKMLGVAGINADINKCGFVIDKNVYWKALELAQLKTKDVSSVATIEGGVFNRIYGFPVIVSNQMCFQSAARLSNADGWVDQTTVGNNLYGSIMAVRWDQWKFGWKRRMTLETTRIPRADVTEIVALMRFGLVYRDTQAAALSYGISV